MVLPIAADLLHLIAATAWADAPLYSVVLYRPLAMPQAASLHLPDLAALSGSPYGHALLLKSALALAILALAAVDRWLLLPRLQREHAAAALGRAMLFEIALLLVVLAVTGLLTVSPVPHGP